MLDAPLRRLLDPSLNRIGAALARTGIGADALTLAGLAVGVAAVPALAVQAYGVALALFLLNRALDGLDGAVARHAGATDRGGFLDIVADFIVYSAVVFGFALAQPDQALAAAFLIFSFVGTGSSFLAFAVMAQRRGLTTNRRGSKSLYYLGGLTEGTETIAVFVAMCLAPQAFAWIAWIFGALCWFTTAVRIVEGWQAFSGRREDSA